jgi:diguanylate cyclase (GGDEF)-like protein
VASDLANAILSLCTEMDSMAARVYASFAAGEPDAGVRALWVDLGRDEAQHVAWWRLLVRQVGEGSLPEPFENPAALLRTLEEASENTRQLMGTLVNDLDTQKRLSVACLLEFSFLHQGLLQVLRYLTVGEGEENPLAAYDRHLHAFLEGVRAYGKSVDLKMSAQTLGRLWVETRSLLDRSYTDPLTGLLNRRGLKDTAAPLVSLARRNGATVAVAMVDIDMFKSVNDARGHDVGDRVLAAVARTIRGSVRASDLVARIGGEEFAVLLPDVDASSLREIGEKIRSEVERHPMEGIAVTVSVGIAGRPMVRDSDVTTIVDELTREADGNLSLAKRGGRNRVVA